MSLLLAHANLRILLHNGSILLRTYAEEQLFLLLKCSKNVLQIERDIDLRTFFPTRQVFSEHQIPPVEVDDTSQANSSSARTFQIDAVRIDGVPREARASTVALKRFVLGIDAAPMPMSEVEISALGDPFSAQVLAQGRPSLTVRDLVTSIGALPGAEPISRKTFLIAEGGQARLANPAFELNARLVMVWQRGGSRPDLMLSTVPAADDPQALLQLAAWSSTRGAFQFFERERRSGDWIWAGDSFHALDPRSRGKGPFDSHINGALVMKELKAPWTHWHSVSASIPPEAFPVDSQLRTEPLFAQIESAHRLEPIVQTGVRAWTTSRFDAMMVDGRLTFLRDALRQLLWCTSINLVSSSRVFGRPENDAYPLPTTFFYDFDGFAFLLGELAPDDTVLPAGRLEAPAALYHAAVAQLELAVTDDGPSSIRIQGDTHFAFLVPERAFEDQAVLRELVQREVISSRLALCLLMVDFSNPVFSPRRAALLAHVPSDAAVGDSGRDLDAVFWAAVRAAMVPGSPEEEFVELFDMPDLVSEVRVRLQNYDAAVRATLGTAEGVVSILELADSRRKTVGDRRALAEFRSTMAFGRSPKGHLAMAADARVFLKQSDIGEDEK